VLRLHKRSVDCETQKCIKIGARVHVINFQKSYTNILILNVADPPILDLGGIYDQTVRHGIRNHDTDAD
jgi:hypothetical protein